MGVDSQYVPEERVQLCCGIKSSSKKLDELSVRGRESKSGDLGTPSVSYSLRVRENHIFFMFQALSTD